MVYLTPTFLVPQIVGGLILGAGFIIGGYCPGTSCVSAATGRVDGMVYVAGMVGGLLGFGELYPKIEHFAKSTALGRVTIPGLFDLPYGLLVLAVVVMALAAFVMAEWAEWKIGGKARDEAGLLAPTRRFTSVRRLAAVLLGFGLVAAFAGNPYRGPFARVDTKQLSLDAADPANQMTVERLADGLIEGRGDLLLVDLREPAAYAAYHIPTAVNVPLSELNADFAPRSQRVLCYAADGMQAAQAWFLLRAAGFDGVYLLAGGLDAWKARVLFAAAPTGGASAAEQTAFARQAAIAKHFGGAPQAAGGGDAAMPAALPQLVAPPAQDNPASTATPKRKKKEGC